MNPSVDLYLKQGCMRCKLGNTPACKVNTWNKVLVLLRQLVLSTGLHEVIKWGVPCYTLNNKNVVMVSAFKDYACLSFFKGTLLSDPAGILHRHGEHSQVIAILKFTEISQIKVQSELIKDYIQEAIQLEQSGKKIEKKQSINPLPDEMLQAFREDKNFEKAFYSLTPGRQRGYLIYFSQPKSTASKTGRIEKYKSDILQGIGLNDHYKK